MKRPSVPQKSSKMKVKMPIGFENLVMSNLAESMFSKDLQTDESHLEEKVARPVKQL